MLASSCGRLAGPVIGAFLHPIENRMMKKDVRLPRAALHISWLGERADEPTPVLLMIFERVTPHRKQFSKPPKTMKRPTWIWYGSSAIEFSIKSSGIDVQATNFRFPASSTRTKESAKHKVEIIRLSSFSKIDFIGQTSGATCAIGKVLTC